MALVPPVTVAWGSIQELEDLKTWFYDPQPPENPGDEPLDLRQRAIRRVQAYQTRSTNLPAEIVSTALLTQALLIPPEAPGLVFRTSMTAALIRFVNSLLDPLQKKDKSLPLTVLATTAGLPTVFVEVRHWGTHENSLPSAEVLRDMGIRALEWLWRNYWNKKDERVNLISQWASGAISDAMTVATFQMEPEQCFEKLVVKLTATDDFEQSSRIWQPLVKLLSEGITTFPEDFTHYIVETMSSIPSCSRFPFQAKLDPLPTESSSKLRYPRTLIAWTMHILDLQGRSESSGSAYADAAKLCLHYPNTLAWDLLTQILDEKPYVQSELPYEIANWVTVESRREEADGTLPSSIDQIEAELEEMKKRFVTATEGKSVESGDTEMWMHGWKRYQGDWIPRPIGIL